MKNQSVPEKLKEVQFLEAQAKAYHELIKVTNPLHGVIKITYPNGDGETLLEDYAGFVELQTLIEILPLIKGICLLIK